MKRDKMQLIHDILKCIQDGKVRRTHIMYKANLSHQMLEEYLKDLVNKQLIDVKKHKKSKTYHITQKGCEYLSKYKFIKEFMSAFDLE